MTTSSVVLERRFTGVAAQIFRFKQSRSPSAVSHHSKATECSVAFHQHAAYLPPLLNGASTLALLL